MLNYCVIHVNKKGAARLSKIHFFQILRDAVVVAGADHKIGFFPKSKSNRAAPCQEFSQTITGNTGCVCPPL